MSLLKSFPAEASRRVSSGLIFFCIACAGGAICCLASALSIRWLYRIGFGIGFLGAIVFVLYIWWRLYLGTVADPPQDDQSPH